MNMETSRRLVKMRASSSAALVKKAVSGPSGPNNVPSTTDVDLTVNISNFPPLPAPSKKIPKT